jgi:hypothetical protein
MLGDAIVFQLCATLDFMPAVVLTSKLCPKDVESTVYGNKHTDPPQSSLPSGSLLLHASSGFIADDSNRSPPPAHDGGH